MTQVLPAIIEDTYEEVEKKLKLVAPLVDWVQLDIGDGEFVGHRTWTQVEDLASAPSSLNIDLHIMASDPLTFARRASCVNFIRRITFHCEIASPIEAVITEIKMMKREVGIAVNPNTPIEAFKSLSTEVDAFLIMGVHPGWGGRGFLPETPGRVRALKNLTKGMKVKIGVDGGIHLATGSAQVCVNAGADFLVVGSGIFKAQDPAEAIRQFQQLHPSVI